MDETATEAESAEEAAAGTEVAEENLEAEVVEEAVEETLAEDTETEEVADETFVEEVPVETPEEEVPAEAPVEETPSQEVPTEVVPGADVTYPCPIKISDFKFMGRAINANHYEEWKAALNYTGDDTLNSPENCIFEPNFATYIECKKNEKVAVCSKTDYDGQAFYRSHISWTDWGNTLIQMGKSEYTHEFYVDRYAERMDLVNAFYSGPIRIDMSKQELKAVIGFDESKSREKSTKNGITYKELVLADGTIIEERYSNYYIYMPNGIIYVYLNKDVVRYISIDFDV